MWSTCPSRCLLSGFEHNTMSCWAFHQGRVEVSVLVALQAQKFKDLVEGQKADNLSRGQNLFKDLFKLQRKWARQFGKLWCMSVDWSVAVAFEKSKIVALFGQRPAPPTQAMLENFILIADTWSTFSDGLRDAVHQDQLPEVWNMEGLWGGASWFLRWRLEWSFYWSEQQVSFNASELGVFWCFLRESCPTSRRVQKHLENLENGAKWCARTNVVAWPNLASSLQTGKRRCESNKLYIWMPNTSAWRAEIIRQQRCSTINE